MLDIKFIRENKDIVATGATKKHIKVDIDKLLVLDDKRREMQLAIDQKRAEQNVASDAIAKASLPACRGSKKRSSSRKNPCRRY